MKVFVTGATGYIGTGVVKALHRAGHQVTGLVRSAEKGERLAAAGAEVVAGNLRDARTYAEEAGQCDAIIHLGFELSENGGALDRSAIESLVNVAAKASAPRVVIYTSGIWVLGAMTSDQFADESAACDSPFPMVAFRPETERTVLEAGKGPLVTAVVRPGIVFGGKGGIVDGFFAAADKGEAPTVVGDGHNHWPIVHRDDAADLYVRILESAFTKVAALDGKQRVFHATSPIAERTGDIARAVARSAGRPDEVRFWPLEEARQKLGPFADALALNQQVLSKRSEAVLGWVPRIRSLVQSAPEVFQEWKTGA
jgi:nucleoside-diphosphate-sugar epimerase